ncbi:LytR/AlgR family response regulator transcription factor [Chitinophagaceae bacterium MMS25-I14]
MSTFIGHTPTVTIHYEQEKPIFSESKHLHMAEVTCIIIDDEPKAIDLLKHRLALLFPDLKVTGVFTEWEKGWEAIKNARIDILFLDVSMPQKSGLDFLKLFPKIAFQVIFITAHADFALDAIKYSAAGYVLKPIDDYELSFAVNKALERVQPQAAETSRESSSAINKIGVPNQKGIDYLNTDNILYFESVNKYTKVVTKEYSVVSSYNLGEFKKLLDNHRFIQVHRSYIINMMRIRRYEVSGNVIMEDDMEIPISRNFRNEFMDAFGRLSRTVGLKNKETD